MDRNQRNCIERKNIYCIVLYCMVAVDGVPFPPAEIYKGGLSCDKISQGE